MDDTEMVDGGEATKEVTASLTDAAAIKTHATLVLGLAFCGLAFWFELGRAEGGNELSWAYVFEWPLLAAFAIYMWWKLLHPGFTIRRHREKYTLAPEYEGMLLAWQNEQRRLHSTRRVEEGQRPNLSEVDGEST